MTNWLTNTTNAERYCNEYGFELTSVTRKHAHVRRDSTDYYLTHEQVRSALHPAPPEGATHRGEKWHYYKRDGTTWRVWKEGKGWSIVDYPLNYLISLTANESIEF